MNGCFDFSGYELSKPGIDRPGGSRFKSPEEDWGYLFYVAKVKLGMSLQEIRDATLLQIKVLYEELQDEERENADALRRTLGG